MQHTLQVGQNMPLNDFSGSVIVTHDIDPELDISLTAFLLTDAGKVQGDSGVVFYNQPLGPNGIATFMPAQNSGKARCHKIYFDLNKCPSAITKIAVTLTEDNHNGFNKVKNLKAEIQMGNKKIALEPNQFTAENGIVVLELYLRNGQAKVRSVWRGFESGLDGLCKNYGIEVAADTTVSTQTPDVVQSVNKAASSNTVESMPKINLKKVSGKIDLRKGQEAVLIEKTPEITASVSWETGTDYDIYALVFTKDKGQIDVATFGASGVPPLMSFQNGAVQHMGDIRREKSSVKTEEIKIRLNDNILAVVPVVYSAQSNGTGSFQRYKVSMLIDNQHGTTVNISANNANKDNTIYTCVPGIILNTPQGVVINAIEYYSKPRSEKRPKLIKGENENIEVLMDAGPVNNYK